MRVATDQRETADERHLLDQPPARLGGTDLFRGALVILAAVVIGGLVLSRGIDDDDEVDGTAAIADENDESGESATDPAAGSITDTTALEDPGAPSDSDPLTGAAAGTGGDAATDSGLADPADAGTDQTDDSMTADGTDGTDGADDTATPLDTIRAPAEVRTIVLNAGGPQGIAGRATELLQGASYTTAAAKNADVNGPSAIYYIEGYEAEALAVASVFGPGIDALVQPLDLANPPSADIQEAAVVVVVGNDDVIAVP